MAEHDFAFLLHAFDREDFARNFVMHLLVKNLDAWWLHIQSLDLAGRYGVPAPVAPKLQPWGLVVCPSVTVTVQSERSDSPTSDRERDC